MGPEAVAAFQSAAPYIFAAGTAASMYGSNEQAKQQRGIINRAMEAADETQKKGADQVVSTAQQLSPEARLAQMQQAADGGYQRTMQDINGAGADIIQGSQPVGGSDVFRGALAQRSATEGDRLSRVARELGSTRAVDITSRDNAIKLGRMAEELGSAWNSTRARTRAAQQDAEAVDMPTIGTLGQVAQLVGGAGMMGAGAGGGGELSGMDLAGDAAIGAGNNVWGAGAAAKTAGAGAGTTAMGYGNQAPIWGNVATSVARQRRYGR